MYRRDFKMSFYVLSSGISVHGLPVICWKQEKPHFWGVKLEIFSNGHRREFQADKCQTTPTDSCKETKRQQYFSGRHSPTETSIEASLFQ